MSPAEVAWRARDQALQLAWARRQVSRDQLSGRCMLPPGERRFTAVLPPEAAAAVPPEAGAAILRAADGLLRGEWEVLGVARTDLAAPDWFRDPVTGRRSAPDRYCFRINHRSEEQVGNVKQVWEISRLQHLTLLATAWYLSHDPAYAERVAEQLRSWWRENPFLSGVHWTSGIEIGIRLISLAWIRRLLDDWPGVADLFEDNALAVAQIRWHQRYLAGFRSRGSSANNHVIAEAAGQLAASCAFGWFPESERWRRQSARLLEDELIRNTFPSGIGRELASDYHGFVAELGLLAAVEAAAAGHPLSTAAWQRLAAMVDSAAALVDERLRPPRQGDGDEGRALLLDAPVANRWPSLLAAGRGAVRSARLVAPGIAGRESVLIGALARAPRAAAGTARAAAVALRRRWRDDPAHRTGRCTGDLVPVRRRPARLSQHCRARARRRPVRGGPARRRGHPRRSRHLLLPRRPALAGLLPLDDRAQHRRAGRPEPVRRAAARSCGCSTRTAGRLEVRDDRRRPAAGPRSTTATCRWTRRPGTGAACGWTSAARTLEIVDEIEGGGHDIRLAFHLGPEVEAELVSDGSGSAAAILRWPGATPGAAWLELPASLRWSLHRGETDPILGWYAEGLGRRSPSYTLLGYGPSRFPLSPFSRECNFLTCSRASKR